MQPSAQSDKYMNDFCVYRHFCHMLFAQQAVIVED